MHLNLCSCILWPFANKVLSIGILIVQETIKESQVQDKLNLPSCYVKLKKSVDTRNDFKYK